MSHNFALMGKDGRYDDVESSTTSASLSSLLSTVLLSSALVIGLCVTAVTAVSEAEIDAFREYRIARNMSYNSTVGRFFFFSGATVAGEGLIFVLGSVLYLSIVLVPDAQPGSDTCTASPAVAWFKASTGGWVRRHSIPSVHSLIHTLTHSLSSLWSGSANERWGEGSWLLLEYMYVYRTSVQLFMHVWGGILLHVLEYTIVY